MDEDDIYDEFGNLIGDPLDSDAESVESISEQSHSYDNQSLAVNKDMEEDDDEEKLSGASNAIVLVEDKKYYNSLSETFGQDVETVIGAQDKQLISEPLVKPNVTKVFKIDTDDEKNLPKLNYSREYLLDSISTVPDRIRTIAVVGNLHAGKTTFLDMLILQTHKSIKLSTSLKTFKPLRYMDNHKLAIERGISIKCTPITLLLPDLQSKSHVFNILDTPGHVNFFDEVSIATTTADSIVLVVDCVEGVAIGSEMAINNAMKKNLPITLVLNKIDRLILELRLPINDAYHKLRHTTEQVNRIIADSEYLGTYTHSTRISPELNNVCFASSSLEFCFNLRSFSQIYSNTQNVSIDIDSFSQRLWGDIYYSSTENKFTSNSANLSLPRSFNHFILEPIYKIFSSTISADLGVLEHLLWKNFGVNLPSATYKLDSQILLKEICKVIFSASTAFVDMVSKSTPSPVQNFAKKITSTLKSVEDLSRYETLAHVTKLVESADGKSFYALTRIYQGKLKLGDRIKILGEHYAEDEEDFKIETIKELYLPGGRYRVPISEMSAGGIVLVGGIESIITKSATIYDAESTYDTNSELNYFRPIDYIIESVFKVAIEPKNPSELPKLLEGLRKVNKSYAGCVIKVEESGEHVVLTSGEIYMDCLLHDLRHYFTNDLEIKVSEPITKFNETCLDTSVTKISTNSNNGKNTISIIAEPIDDDKLVRSIEIAKIDLQKPVREVSKIFRNEFKWDALSARTVWSFGPTDFSPNILQDDTLEGETDKSLLYSVKDSIKQGFKWATREGPLCDEPIRNTKFKILDAILHSDSLQRGGGQIIPMTRKACYTGLITATPRLMEPIYSVHIQCSSKAIHAVKMLVERRRGAILRYSPIPATQLFTVYGYVPVIDSIGLETDIRVQTQGQAMCLLTFEKWDIVPGDPLDADAFIPKLRPAPFKSLARDFVMKTRKRKGLSGEPNLAKYLEPELIEQLKQSGLIGY